MKIIKAMCRRIEGALGRVFVRSTIYVILLLMTFSALNGFINYRHAAQDIEERLLAAAQRHAAVAVALGAEAIAGRDVVVVEKVLNAVSKEDYVISVQAFDDAGLVFADSDLSQIGSDIDYFDWDVLGVMSRQEPLLKDKPTSITHILPVSHGGKVMGAVSITMSKAEIAQTKAEIVSKAIFLTVVFFLVFGPIAAILIFKSTNGISKVTDAANEAAQGFLDTKLQVTATGEIGELQSAFQQMAINLRNNMRRIEYLANIDEVTRLPNRLKFGNVATQMIDLSPKAAGAMFLIDLDRFKAINDSHGHDVGDRLLLLVGERIEAIVRSFTGIHLEGKQFLSRLAGDEFVVIVPGFSDPGKVQELSDLLLEGFVTPFSIDNLKLSVRASIGVSIYPVDGRTSDEVLRCADMAMFSAKQAGRDTCVIFNEDIRNKAVERQKIELGLRTALENNELKVFYQPKVDFATGQIIGSEALLRWQHPELGNVPPWKFIPLAEECGFMTSIGEFVLRQSLEDMKQMRAEGHDLSIAVNVAPVQFQSAYFTDRTLGILGESQFPLERLELEITESSIMDDPKRVMDQIKPIKEEGVRFAIDDFGTGYSSLNTLATMPFDTLKIDRSFVMNMEDCEDRRAIVQLILMMAQQLRMNTVAEGVETDLQFDHLKAWGTTYAQGYLWSPPIDFAAFKAMVRERAAGAIDPEKIRA